jgi:hypothetical protein
MPQDTRILFVHIPKTGGISLYSALSDAIGRERALRFPEGSKEHKLKYLAMPSDEVRRHALLSGHFPLAFYFHQPVTDYQVITVVRDAVDRELSAYFYMKNWKEHPRHHIVGRMDLHQFIEHRAKQRDTNRQCAILGGTGTYVAAFKALRKHRVLAAPTEYLGEFSRVLEQRLGLGPLKVGRENVTESRLAVDEVPADARKRLEEITGEDQRLYEFVKRNFEREFLEDRRSEAAVADGRLG